MAERERMVHAGDWTDWTPAFTLGLRIWAKRLTIIVMRLKGQAVVRRGRGFGISVHYHILR